MRKAAWFLYVVSLALAAGLTAFSSRLSPALAQDDADIIAPADMETCLGCHGDAADMAKLASSAHGNVTCQACHRGVDRFPHPEQAVANKAACASCHARIGAQMAGSVHRAGAAKGKAPTCRSCHPGSAHAITRARAQSPAAQDAACAACHAGEAAAVKRSIHGQPGISGGPRAGCRACHERNPHAIRPPGARAKEESCRACHDDVHTALAGSVHKGAALACAACHTGSMHAVRRAPAPSAKTDAACRACHRESLTAMAGTAHAGQSCRACHDADAHRIQPPPRDAAAASARCAACHAGVAQAMTTSVHGRAVAVGKPNAPQCVTCHGEKAHGVAKAAALAAQPRDAACRACHADAARALRDSVHRDAFTENGTPASCFACHGAGPHAVQTINAGTAAQLVALCQRCHADKVAMPGTSKHDLPDIVAGDHPTCLTCHTDSVHGASAHGITKPPAPTPRDQVVLCSRCHDDAALMGRYGMTTDSVSSYRQSFHGRAVVNFKMAGSATCTDCHGLHAVMAPDAADSPVNPANVAATCGQCHPGAKMNFAMSGANHLRLKIAQNPILRIEEMAFMWLIYGAMSFLFIMVLLDLRRKLFDPDCLPACGKPITLLISAGLLALVGGIIFAYLHLPFAWIFWVASVVIAIIAYTLNYLRRKRLGAHGGGGRVYQRFTLCQRWQHGLLALSFTLLVLTGFPLHFAQVEWTRYLLVPFGGLEGARIVHRVAGLLMVTNWIWHLFYLLYRWKKHRFSLKSWTMFPTWKDVRDVIDYFKWGLGLRKHLPEWERFQFREKFDYFADIWGTIVMGTTGFILWFPVAIGNHLPDWAFGFAYIAHSYEGTLALMAILVWHFYNTHFNPDMFPMNPVWWTGTMSEEEMAREHPLEKVRLDAESAGDASLTS